MAFDFMVSLLALYVSHVDGDIFDVVFLRYLVTLSWLRGWALARPGLYGKRRSDWS